VFPEYVWVERFNPYDFKNGKMLSFTIAEDRSYMKIDRLRFVDGEPLWTEGEPKDKILSMYDGVSPMDEIVEAYKADLKERYPDALFGDDAKKSARDLFA
jgi:hypothetical protein